MDLRKIFLPINLRNDIRDSMRELFSSYLNPEMEVYDIGCGDKPFSEYLYGKVKKHYGVDIDDGFYDSSFIDIVGSAYDIPVEDGVADAAISSQVIEHLNEPIAAIKETSRILKTGGLFFISYPFLYPMHAMPRDYLRYTHYYMDNILKEHDFEILETKHISGFWYCIGLNSNLYILSFDRGPLKKIGVIKLLSWVVRLIFTLPHRAEGAALSLFGKNKEKSRENWIVNYAVVARKKEAHIA